MSTCKHGRVTTICVECAHDDIAKLQKTFGESLAKVCSLLANATSQDALSGADTDIYPHKHALLNKSAADMLQAISTQLSAFADVDRP